MKRFVTTLIIAICSTASLFAQTYTEHLKQKVQGKGSVTITQSKEIDELVNGNNRVQQANTPKKIIPVQTTQKSAADKNNNITSRKNESDNTYNNVQKSVSQSNQSSSRNNLTNQQQDKDSEKKAEETHREVQPTTQPIKEDNEMDIPVVDLRKKVMRNSYKVTGYRVQAFSGGNSREDKNKAQQIGNDIKMQLPELPIYVHFYSPRWICRVGNFRSYEEASRVLKKVRSMGYKSATIVRGKITVQY